jgi:hypothetical protein
MKLFIFGTASLIKSKFLYKTAWNGLSRFADIGINIRGCFLYSGMIRLI